MIASRTNRVQPTGSLHFGALLEFVIAVSTLEVAIWTANFGIRVLAGTCAGILILRCYWKYARCVPEVGFRGASCPGKPQPIPITGSTIIIFSLLVSFFVCGLAFLLDLWTPNLNSIAQRSTVDWLTVKIPTVAVQQILFQMVFVPTLYFATRHTTWTFLGSALAFSLLHLPNPLLMVLTFGIGLVWFSMVVYKPRLLPIVASHLMLAVVVANVAEEYVLDMRVGQVCFQKWPQELTGQSDNRTITVYPRAVSGEIQSVTQFGTNLNLQGNVYDFSRLKSPETVFVVLGNYDPADETGESWQPMNIQSAKVDENGDFKLDFRADTMPGRAEVRLFVRHRYGWCYPVNDSARLNLVANDPSGETVCLHPKEYHGNIGHVKTRSQHTDLIGWGFSMKTRKLINTLLVLSDNRLQTVELSRRKRVEISEYYSDPKLINCGFVSKLPQLTQRSSLFVYVRNSRKQLERMPLDLADHQAKKTSRVSDRLVR